MADESKVGRVVYERQRILIVQSRPAAPWFCPACGCRWSARAVLSEVADDGVTLVFCPRCRRGLGAQSSGF